GHGQHPGYRGNQPPRKGIDAEEGVEAAHQEEEQGRMDPVVRDLLEELVMGRSGGVDDPDLVRIEIPGEAGSSDDHRESGHGEHRPEGVRRRAPGWLRSCRSRRYGTEVALRQSTVVCGPRGPARVQAVLGLRHVYTVVMA